jgi:hemerythrin superfamily protein
MDVLMVMKKDHDKAFELIEKLEDLTEEPSGESLELTRQLVLEVLVHAQSEEKALYQMCELSGGAQLRNFSLEGRIEHSLVEETLRRLLSLAPGEDGEFKAALKVAKELLYHHARQEEEKKIFPLVKKYFTSDERHQMGETMLAARERLRPRMEALLTIPGPWTSLKKINLARSAQLHVH